MLPNDQIQLLARLIAAQRLKSMSENGDSRLFEFSGRKHLFCTEAGVTSEPDDEDWDAVDRELLQLAEDLRSRAGQRDGEAARSSSTPLEELPLSPRGPGSATYAELLMLAMVLRRRTGLLRLGELVSVIRSEADVPEAQLRACFWRLVKEQLVDVEPIQANTENGGPPAWELLFYRLNDTGRRFALEQMQQLTAVLRVAGYETPDL